MNSDDLFADATSANPDAATTSTATGTGTPSSQHSAGDFSPGSHTKNDGPLLSPALLQRLERMELVSRKIFRGQMKGERNQPAKRPERRVR